MTNLQSSLEWFSLCDRKLSDARALAAHGSADGAYQLLAEAAECAAKGTIMRREGMNRWPDKKDRPALYSHNLVDLFAASDLLDCIRNRNLAPRETRICYGTLKGLHLRRYQRQGMPRKTVQGLIEDFANDEHGLLQWLKKI